MNPKTLYITLQKYSGSALASIVWVVNAKGRDPRGDSNPTKFLGIEFVYTSMALSKYIHGFLTIFDRKALVLLKGDKYETKNHLSSLSRAWSRDTWFYRVDRECKRT